MEKGQRLPFLLQLGSARVGPSPLLHFLRPGGTWGRVLEAMGQWLPFVMRPACVVLKGPVLLVAVRGPSYRRCGQLGKAGEEMGREPQFLRLLGSVTEPTSPLLPVGFPLSRDTWEKAVVVKDPSLPRCGQLEKALEARDPVRLEQELKFGCAREERCTL